ncbi:ubiquitin-like domain-containing protein CIP73 isoform X1 [Papaver somniferum]|uniref:ubiquitin-like domain-containing protein CIP73 isoform X1 n=1 Tax=Papaver somniferum TaxID=3469 RepID=UPI000E6F6918|nr:ubiquitin-like domain-containing protein CIP73 isoform X1 [Papaver somniferum]XP_026394042.1 ubiquitin-like domain-containing protein CIP73 isoform X1 [Papaver somniferum]
MADESSAQEASTSAVTGESSDSIVEVNVKTLDSQIYTFRVEKNMPVPLFKEKIAGTVGVPVEQQRLIFRGKVLKDNQCLSEYHVEDGHTLHLVARQPAQPQTSSGTLSGEANANTNGQGNDPNTAVPRNRVGQVSHSVVLGTFNVGDQGENGGVPDLTRIVGAVLNSIGLGGQIPMGATNTSSSVPPNATNQTSQAAETEGTRGNVAGRGGGQAFPSQPFQSLAQSLQFPLTGAAVNVPSHQMPIPDSLSTLLEFINCMELVLRVNGGHPSASENTGDPPRVELPSNARGLRTPEALGIVLRQAQQLLSSHAAAALSHIAERLEGEGGATDPAVRSQIQTESVQVGRAMQHLGALFLELGRTIVTLRMGQSPAESSVNAGPAVYISSSGPNPIMVQPFPIQTSSLFGGGAATQTNAGIPVPVGLGDTPRHVNIHIHAGTSLAGVPSVGPRPNTGEVSQGENRNGASGDSGSGSGRMLPVRSVLTTAVPSSRVPVDPSHTRSSNTTSIPRTEQSNPNAASAAQGSNEGTPSVGPSSASTIHPMVSEINAQLRNLVRDMGGENVAPSGPSESPSNQGLATGSVSGDGAGNSQQERSHKDDKSPCKEASASSSAGGSSCAGDATKQVVSDDVSRSSGSHGVKDVPLGLGLGGLQPKLKRGRQGSSQVKNANDATSSGVPTSNQNQQAITSGQQILQSLVARGSNARTDSNGVSDQIMGARPSAVPASNSQFDAAGMMSQVLNSPALNGLLSGVSEQAGMGSPDGLRGMLDQFTRNPAMMNMINQVGQQIGGGQDLGGMFSGMGRGQGGGLDLSSMVQQMMPIVTQALNRGVSFPESSREVEPQPQEQPMEIGTVRENENSRNPQIDLQQTAERIERHDPPADVFRSVVENTALLYGKGNSSEEELVDDICSNEDLADEFMEMLSRDVRRRLDDSR